MGLALNLWKDTGTPLDVPETISRDPSWLKLLPPRSTVVSALGHSASYWSQTGKITVRLEDGSSAFFFIKISETDRGRLMAETEYESMSLIHRAIPDNSAKPIGWGTYESCENVHWFMARYVDLYDERWPLKSDIARCMAEMHLNSQGFHPGRFGFHVPKCEGPVVEYVKWSESWEEFFIEFLKDLFKQEKATSGISPEMEALIPTILEKVCPRLLRPLETDGRSITPSILHGDLWHGNTAQQQRNGQPVIFDGSSIWGHHEFDLHSWRGGRYIFNQSYIEEYFKHCPPSEPKEEWRDRNDLYYLVSGLATSLCFHKTDTDRMYQNECLQGMKALVAKFGDGYTGPHERKGASEVRQE